ncbi:MAG: phosphomannomutase CpsG [Methylophaga sp.]
MYQSTEKLSCFKAYDIRGKLGDELNEDIAYRIGYAFASHLGAKKVVVGGDIRETSEPLKLALAHGLTEAGAEVIDIGMVGTEEIYFASFYLDVDGGIEVTASHNPLDYNGMKLVGRGALPISGDSGLNDIRDLAETVLSPYRDASAAVGMTKGCHSERSRGISKDAINAADITGEGLANQSVIASKAKQSIAAENTESRSPRPSGLAMTEKKLDSHFRGNDVYSQKSILGPYVDHLLTYIDLKKLKPLKLVVNAGNGAAGHVIDAIETIFLQKNIPVEFIKIHHEPDGSFPNGIPNPLLPENRAVTADAVKLHQANMGIAWDGDFDRCFLFDENGRFIEGYYIVGLLAEAFLRKCPGEKIIHDPRLTWNTIDQVKAAGGKPIQSKTGHAFIKERMRLENAVYGGEMSAHHYFRDFAYCDSGMIPWLLVSELLSVSGKSLSQLVDERILKYPCSGEINYRVDNVPATLERIISFYFNSDLAEQSNQQPIIDKTDGISIEFAEWRFNLRASNTEPLLRLNVESHGDTDLVWMKVTEIEGFIQSQ